MAKKTKWLKRLKFEGPYQLSNGAWQEHARSEPMVYRIRAWDLKTKKPRPIPRAARLDTSGILDIGESEKGLGRIEAFLGAAQGKKRSHRAGLEYSANEYDFGSVFPLNTLMVDFLHVESKELAEALELALLEEYRWLFKDRPPLNGSAGKYRKVYDWLHDTIGRDPRDADGWLDLEGLLPRG
ncbi:MAG: hypothetical protein J7M25_07095 [Deltaproteobacteria bacterium]|nr:hypothetical protein [Deltaproteobacteria bacterium]